MLLEGPIRHARSTCSLLLCACSGLHLWPKHASACIVLQVGVQCVIALSPHTWQYDCSCSSWCLNAHQFARRLLDDEGWCWAPSVRKQRNDSLLLQHLRRPLFRFLLKVTREQEIGVPVHSGLFKVFTEVLPVVAAEKFFPGHRLLLFLDLSKDTCSCNGARQVVALQEPCWQHVGLPHDQTHGGDGQNNVDAHKLVLVGNCTPLQLPLRWLQLPGHLRQDAAKLSPLLSE